MAERVRQPSLPILGLALIIPRLFFSKHAEIAIVGLQVRPNTQMNLVTVIDPINLEASGKTSFVNVLGSGQVRSSCIQGSFGMPSPVLNAQQWSEDVVPTVAFNLRVVKKGNVSLKIWDVAGMSPAMMSPALGPTPPRSTKI